MYPSWLQFMPSPIESTTPWRRRLIISPIIPSGPLAMATSSTKLAMPRRFSELSFGSWMRSVWMRGMPNRAKLSASDVRHPAAVKSLEQTRVVMEGRSGASNPAPAGVPSASRNKRPALVMILAPCPGSTVRNALPKRSSDAPEPYHGAVSKSVMPAANAAAMVASAFAWMCGY